MTTDLRQSTPWAQYLSRIGWEIEDLDGVSVFIRSIPILGSLIKIQRPPSSLSLEKIDWLAKKHRALFAIVEPKVEGYKEEPFRSAKYSKSSLILLHTSTVQIDLTQSEKELWRSFSENARRNIRKAQHHHLKVKQVLLNQHDAKNEFDKFLILLRNLTKLKKFYAPKAEEYYKKMDALKDNSFILFAYKPERREPIAGVWMGFWEDRIYYMQTGITKEGYNLLANYLLVWEAVKTGKKMGFKTFDFEGIYDPRFPKERQSWKNFSEFKKRFHGSIIEFPPPWIKFYNPILKVIYLCSKIMPG